MIWRELELTEFFKFVSRSCVSGRTRRQRQEENSRSHVRWKKGREGEIHPILILYDDGTLDKSTLDIWIIYCFSISRISEKKYVELEDVSYLDFLYSLNISFDQRLTKNAPIVTTFFFFFDFYSSTSLIEDRLLRNAKFPYESFNIFIFISLMCMIEFLTLSSDK